MYYQLIKNEEKAELYIYGDIVSYQWEESDVTGYSLVQDLQDLEGVDAIDVYISSYGGSVKEGLAIYNALKRQGAKVRTYVDGFACSIASVIFCAGDERIMNESSLLMIHNAWTYAAGDSKDLKKTADDLEKITSASKKIYLSVTGMDEETLSQMMDQETWISAEEALAMGFITQIEEAEETEQFTQSARMNLRNKLLAQPQAGKAEIKLDGVKLDEEDLEEVAKKIAQSLKEKAKEEIEDEENGLGQMFLGLFK